ncbi:unnamed protein product [Acanthoscelides obtectus]|nr:unnamed protein product [Acanthoscelides obtectus]CAK1626632.1 Protein peste [Acanthoscelides obtectus]
MMKRRRRQCGQICLLLTGILLISTGLSIFVFFDAIYEFILKGALQFSPTSKSYAAWKTNDPPLSMDIYIFNWTNPQEVMANSSVKPEFVEVGPYRFKEIKDKLNITWNENKTVSFMFKKTYYFDVERSVRQLNDSICTINAVPLTVSYKSKNFGFWSKKMISLGLSSISSVYVKKTAGEILFDGYEEPILSTLSNFPMLNVEDKFGIFYGVSISHPKNSTNILYARPESNVTLNVPSLLRAPRKEVLTSFWQLTWRHEAEKRGV